MIELLIDSYSFDDNFKMVPRQIKVFRIRSDSFLPPRTIAILMKEYPPIIYLSMIIYVRYIII